MLKHGMQYVMDINHVEISKAILVFRVIKATFKRNKIPINLSTVIRTKLKTDTIDDTILKYTPTLHPKVASE